MSKLNSKSCEKEVRQNEILKNRRHRFTYEGLEVMKGERLVPWLKFDLHGRRGQPLGALEPLPGAEDV